MPPTHADVQVALAMIKRRRGDRRGSFNAFHKATEINPRFVGAHLEMANDLRELGDLHGSERVLSELVIRYPRTAIAWIYIGLLARRRGDHNKALEAFSSAADLEPNNIATQLERIQELRFLNRTSDAEEALEDLAKNSPRHPAPTLASQI